MGQHLPGARWWPHLENSEAWGPREAGTLGNLLLSNLRMQNRPVLPSTTFSWTKGTGTKTTKHQTQPTLRLFCLQTHSYQVWKPSNVPWDGGKAPVKPPHVATKLRRLSNPQPNLQRSERSEFHCLMSSTFGSRNGSFDDDETHIDVRHLQLIQ
jgi:hypothetical protein